MEKDTDMPVYKGPHSGDDKECNTGVGLDRDAYYPSRAPNKYTTSQRPINLATKIDGNFYESIGEEGERLKGGFSGALSRNRQK
jgi:hypothetical protein